MEGGVFDEMWRAVFWIFRRVIRVIWVLGRTQSRSWDVDRKLRKCFAKFRLGWDRGVACAQGDSGVVAFGGN